jgi:hypothetical protein
MKGMADKVDLGVVHSIEVRPDPGAAEILGLQVWYAGGEKILLACQREALRGLWYNLMQILYPRAVAMTNQMETVVRRKDGTPPDVTFMMSAISDSTDPRSIIIGGFTPNAYWHLKIGWDACENLWSSLEDHLNQV